MGLFCSEIVVFNANRIEKVTGSLLNILIDCDQDKGLNFPSILLMNV